MHISLCRPHSLTPHTLSCPPLFSPTFWRYQRWVVSFFPGGPFQDCCSKPRRHPLFRLDFLFSFGSSFPLCFSPLSFSWSCFPHAVLVEPIDESVFHAGYLVIMSSPMYRSQIGGLSRPSPQIDDDDIHSLDHVAALLDRPVVRLVCFVEPWAVQGTPQSVEIMRQPFRQGAEPHFLGNVRSMNIFLLLL